MRSDQAQTPPVHSTNLQMSTLNLASDRLLDVSALSKYARNGRDAARIRNVLRGEARCCASSCSQNCKARVPERLLLQLCDVYWRLRADEQAWLAPALVYTVRTPSYRALQMEVTKASARLASETTLSVGT